ncbi:MAG: biopolymer transporter ExbD [Acholeplasmataceae bacterium]|nr:biopolymer transporter ExbD [Acholeplasmataceae bacterium]
MKLRDSRQVKTPDLMIIPMIDIMFFLLVFFMISTMYMVDLKTIPVKLPTAANSSVDTRTTFSVSIKKDGSIWLGDKQTDARSLAMQALMEQKANPNFAIVIRADKDADYGEVIAVLDLLRGAGINRFGLATDVGAGK